MKGPGLASCSAAPRPMPSARHLCWDLPQSRRQTREAEDTAAHFMFLIKKLLRQSLQLIRMAVH